MMAGISQIKTNSNDEWVTTFVPSFDLGLFYPRMQRRDEKGNWEDFGALLPLSGYEELFVAFVRHMAGETIRLVKGRESAILIDETTYV